ncbi:MAG: hypothetical protein WCG25_09015 [bacterium]
MGIFAPFYDEEIKKLNLTSFFDGIYDFEENLNLDNYVAYLKKLS